MTNPQPAPAPHSDQAVEAGPDACADGPDDAAAPEGEPRAARRGWRSTSSAAGVLLSLAFHGALLAAGLAWAKSESGAIQQTTEAISIEMTLTSVIESADESPIPDTAASDASAAQKRGNAEAQSVEAVPAAEIEAKPPPEAEVIVVVDDVPEAVAVPPPTGLDVIEGTLEGGEAAGQATGADDAKQPPKANKETPPEDIKQKREAVKPVPERPRPAAKEKQRTAALEQGGVTSKARSGSVASSGRVSASKGDLVGYKQRVNARVAGNKPSGSGGRGTATVSFGVTSSGSLSYARLSRSSGSAGLDSAAVAAVRRAGPFGPTPTGGPLSFSFSFYFR